MEDDLKKKEKRKTTSTKNKNGIPPQKYDKIEYELKKKEDNLKEKIMEDNLNTNKKWKTTKRNKKEDDLKKKLGPNLSSGWHNSLRFCLQVQSTKINANLGFPLFRKQFGIKLLGSYNLYPRSLIFNASSNSQHPYGNVTIV
jgi:hypothetical protein